jgi:hypothetical protein
MGGSYATDVSVLGTLASGRIPRTGNDSVALTGDAIATAPFSLPTVGFRVACVLPPE